MNADVGVGELGNRDHNSFDKVIEDVGDSIHSALSTARASVNDSAKNDGKRFHASKSMLCVVKMHNKKKSLNTSYIDCLLCLVRKTTHG